LTLKEISRGYRSAAGVLRERLCYLRRQLREETDPDQRWRIKRSIADLTDARGKGISHGHKSVVPIVCVSGDRLLRRNIQERKVTAVI
jgi:hypothetical protein